MCVGVLVRCARKVCSHLGLLVSLLAIAKPSVQTAREPRKKEKFKEFLSSEQVVLVQILRRQKKVVAAFGG